MQTRCARPTWMIYHDDGADAKSGSRETTGASISRAWRFTGHEIPAVGRQADNGQQQAHTHSLARNGK